MIKARNKFFTEKLNLQEYVFRNCFRFLIFLLLTFQFNYGYPQDNVPELDIDVTEGIVDPIPIAFPNFITNDYSSSIIAKEIIKIVKNDLINTSLFRIVPEDSYISELTSIDAPVRFADWRAINTDLLVSANVSVNNEIITIKFRLWDVIAQSSLTTKVIPLDRSLREIRRLNSGLKGVCRITVMRILNLSSAPESLL